MNDEPRLPLHETLDHLPPEWPEDLLPAIQQKVRESGRKVVVLDDDPTGTQTVHDVPVLTEWPVERLVAELEGASPVIYLLTNSRSMPLGEAQALNRDIGDSLQKARARTGLGFDAISRSDSTLRGHFPGEVRALANALQEDFSAWLVAPFFAEGGRYTMNDIHYVAEGDWLVPAGQTEFARDKSFGYHASNLRKWVMEKSGGTITASQVASISIEDLRLGGPEKALRKLLDLPKGAVCVANAASSRDLEVLALALLEAEARGRRYLYRTAASFVRVRAGMAPQSLLTRDDLRLPEDGAGLIVVGSYVPKTSAQLQALFEQANVERVQVDVRRLLDEDTRAGEVRRALQAVDHHLSSGRDTVLYTSRELVSAEEQVGRGEKQDANRQSAEAELAIGRQVSESLVKIIQGLSARPRYLLAKGGITSSDIATRGLGIRRAMVMGQLLPGVPVWRTGEECRYPDLVYIVFPGNVGGPDALAKIVRDLRG